MFMAHKNRDDYSSDWVSLVGLDPLEKRLYLYRLCVILDITKIMGILGKLFPRKSYT